MLKNRLKKYIFINLIIFAAGIFLIVTRIFIQRSQNEIFQFIIECPTHFIFNIYCPTCGGTRALIALLRFDIISALKYNAFVVYLVCLFIYFDAFILINILKNKKSFIPKIWGIITLVLMILFFIFRNIAVFKFGVDYLSG